MPMNFLLQAENDSLFNFSYPTMSPDVASFLEGVREYLWLHPHESARCSTVSLNAIQSHVYDESTLKTFVPVGSIEFVEEVLRQAYGIQQLKPQNVPLALRAVEYCRRRMAFASGADGVHNIMDDWDVGSVFIKSANKVKCDYAGIYRRADAIPDVKDLFLVSECLTLVSEWRAFVSREKLVDIRYYMGDPWISPNPDVVRAMVRSMGPSLPAYTLDVAVTADGKTVFVEIHNFISCGLYGASVPLLMYTDAYRHEIKTALGPAALQNL